mgnify:FL=1
MKQNLKIGFCIAPVFCSFLCLMSLFIGKHASITFYANLPLCFMLAAFPSIALYKKVKELEEQLEELKNKNNS